MLKALDEKEARCLREVVIVTRGSLLSSFLAHFMLLLSPGYRKMGYLDIKKYCESDFPNARMCKLCCTY
jgi:hypothetical protein